MWALFKRELNGFFNSLIAYVVISVFLIIVGLFVWIFPGDYNIPDSGYANLDGFFILAPFVFLFLIPAITMRFYADELRSGTYEMLITKPITDLQIVLAKYFAGVALVFVSLLPTLLFFFSLQLYAVPPGIDSGGVWGSYLGLFFLGMVFVAVGIFSSAITDNQIVAFIVGLLLSGFLFIGFEMIHSATLFGRLDLFVRNLGLQAHYSSMGRGVVDSRDILYFLGVIVMFLALAKQAAGYRQYRRLQILPSLSVLLFVIIVNVAGSQWFTRLDLTGDKRYTLTDATRNMLQELDDIVFFRVYLDGELPAEFRRLRNDTRELLDEFSAWSEYIDYEFISPSQAAGHEGQQLQEYYRRLTEKGLGPAQVQMRAGDGTSQRVIFPGAIVSYKGKEIPLQLLKENLGVSLIQALHNASLALEYNLASATMRLTTEEKQRIAFLSGHGELEAPQVSSARRVLETFYTVDRLVIGDNFEKMSKYRTLISAKPQMPFSEEEKFLLDQFLMQGGSMLWLVDPVFADMDSLMTADETFGMAMDLNLNDFFFRYGLRLNPVLLQDLNAAPIPVSTGFVAGRPQINLMPWYFYPVLTPLSDHAVVNNLNAIRTEFISSLDTVEAPGINKSILLQTSPRTRIMPVPVRISLDMLEQPVPEELYSEPQQNVAVLLEGSFQSLYRNRIAPDVSLPEGFQRRNQGLPAAMIVMADGDLIRNQFDSDGRPLPLGYDRYTGQTFGNEDLILNAVNYLTEDSGIISARVKDVRLRLLDRQRMNDDRLTLQLLNTLLPVSFVMVFGVLRHLWRKRKHRA
jgi:ABC-2 type transport system permease protein